MQNLTRMTILFFLIGFNSTKVQGESQSGVELFVLGVAQDAGYPQTNCYKPHCMPGWRNPDKQKFATSLGLIDHRNKQKYLFEATPDIKQQLYQFHQFAPDLIYELSGIFLTHAHIGHYTGLMHLGKEAAGTKSVPVYAMPRMSKFLRTNGPWGQLVKLQNIDLRKLHDAQIVSLRRTSDQSTNSNLESSRTLKVQPLLVPHRDEYSETVGFKIIGPNKTVLFIPDIDKWRKWSVSINALIEQVDYAFLDATFYANNELPNRDMSKVPHPFVEESMKRFSVLSKKDRAKVIFIHFNHTNPLLIDGSDEQRQVEAAGYRFATQGMRIEL